MRTAIRRLLCWLGFHAWDMERETLHAYGKRIGKGKDRELRWWQFQSYPIGCYYCNWNPPKSRQAHSARED